jgi:predicted Fe-S protein YdhL (DUF1289 family)
MHAGNKYYWAGIFPFCGILQGQSCSGCTYSKREEICGYSRKFIDWEKVRIWDSLPDVEESLNKKELRNFIHVIRSYAIGKLIDLFLENNDIKIESLLQDTGMKIYLQKYHRIDKHSCIC